MTQSRHDVVELRSDANIAPAKDAAAKPGFHGVAYSGGQVRKSGFGRMVIDLATLQFKARAPIVRNHDDDKVVGFADVSCDGRALSIDRGHFSEVTQDGREVAGLMAEGQPWEYSVMVVGDVDYPARGKRVALNGQQFDGLDSVMRNGRLLHISFVPAGADSNAVAAKLSALHGQSPTNGAPMSGDTTPDPQARLAELERENAALKTSNATLTAEKTAAEAAAKATRDAARKARIDSCLGTEAAAALSADDRAGLMEMSDVAFSFFEKRELAARQANPALFRQTATGGRNESQTESAASTVAFKAVDGIEPDPDGVALDAKVRAFMAANKDVTYLQAALAVAD